MKYIFGGVYVLVLITQLPHVWAAYANLENPAIPLAQWTALGAAIAFELSIGVFTYRIIQGSRRPWTRRGLWFFIAASIVANGYYYGWLPLVFDLIMPAFATLALPLSLALFAEEFGAEVKQDERRAKQEERKAERAERRREQITEQPAPFACSLCPRSFDSQAALNGHGNKHRRKHGTIEVPEEDEDDAPLPPPSS